MKKALAIISALAIVSAVAFAEDGLMISGQIQTGINAQSGGGDAVKLWETDAPGPSRIDLNVTYTEADTGLWFNLRSEDAKSAPAVNNFKVWANLFDNKATVVAGNPDDNSWETTADDNFTFENGYGVKLEIKAIEGLNFGVKLNTAAPTDVQYDWTQTMSELGFGMKYTADTFNFSAGYKLDSDAVADGSASEDEASAYVGFGYYGIDMLSIDAEAKFTDLGAYSDFGLAEVNEVVEYAVDEKTTAGILAYQWIPGDSDFESSFSFKLYGKYQFTPVTLLKAEVGYLMNDGYVENVNNLWVEPGVEFQVAPKAQIRADYAFNVKDMGDETAGGTTNISVFNLGFRYSF